MGYDLNNPEFIPIDNYDHMVAHKDAKINPAVII